MHVGHTAWLDIFSPSVPLFIVDIDPSVVLEQILQPFELHHIVSQLSLICPVLCPNALLFRREVFVYEL